MLLDVSALAWVLGGGSFLLSLILVIRSVVVLAGFVTGFAALFSLRPFSCSMSFRYQVSLLPELVRYG